MADNSYSIGFAAVELDGSNLGSLTGASLDISSTSVPIHATKLGEAKLVASEFRGVDLRGTLNVQCEELNQIEGCIDQMRKALRGLAIEIVPFKCSMPLNDAIFSGTVALLPQFSIASSQTSFATASLKCEISDALVVTPGQSFNSIMPAIDLDKRGARTLDANNLCLKDVTVTGISGRVVDSNLTVTCQFKTIYRGLYPRWPKAYVLDGVSVIFEGGIEAFSTAEFSQSGNQDFKVNYNLLGGGSLELNLGSNCNIIKGGMKSGTSGWNTWTIRVEGTQF